MISSRVVLGLMLVMFPLMFIWHTELLMLMISRTGVEYSFTNGWFEMNLLRAYHLYMYLLLFVNFVGAYQIITTKEKIRK